MEYDKIGLIGGVCGRLLTLQNLKDMGALICVIDDRIDNVSTLDFHDGLLGVFWSLSLVQDSIMLPDTLLKKQILFDDFIYKSIVNYVQTDLSLNTGVIGKGLYLYQRIKSEVESNYYRRMLMREALVLCAREVGKLVKKRCMSNKYEQKDIYEMSQVMCFFNAIKNIDINPLIIDTPLTDVRETITQVVPNISMSTAISNLIIYMVKNTTDESMRSILPTQTYDLNNYSSQKSLLIRSLMDKGMEFWPLL